MKNNILDKLGGMNNVKRFFNCSSR
ncbi:hypothetical protein D2A34_05915 [Clostridium chromiireducens]|uniref:Uncharacterized protein n=1 Tax=Clostridium chromiireducens TaxID=225345 RepID=A0A399IRU9_9CLOT|nr:hypothetical protein D2A34_05915 [Clostridium chromiireducens]